MSEEIFVYDNSPYVQNDENYAQIGIGIENPNKHDIEDNAIQSLNRLYEPNGELIDSGNLADSSVFKPDDK